MRRATLVAGLICASAHLASAQGPAATPAAPADGGALASTADGGPTLGVADGGAPAQVVALVTPAPAAAPASPPPVAKPAEKAAPKPSDTAAVKPAETTAAKPVEAPVATPAKDAAAKQPAPASASKVAAKEGGDDAADGNDDGPDEAANQEQIEEESEDLAAMKQAEATVVDPMAGPATRLFLATHRLGGASALAGGLRDALCEERADQPLLPELGADGAIDPNVALAFDIARAKGEYDIPVEMRAPVAQWVTFFQRGGRKYFLHWLARSTRYIPVMKDILRQEGLPEDTVFLSMIESGFSTLAYSWARASGPWQFVEPTGRRFGLKVDFWVDERRDPIKSTRAAARYLRALHEEFGDWYLAWAGYNAGENKIRKGIAKYNTKDFWQMCDSGRFLRNETKNYVPKLIAAALVTKHPQQFGFTKDEVDWQEPLETEEVEVVNPTDIAVLAKAADCSADDLRNLNPELRRWLTPPATPEHPYILRLPKGHKVAFLENYPKVAPKERLSFRIVRVKRGDTLSRIAVNNHSFPEAIMRMNGLKSTRKLRVGTELMVPLASEAALAKAEEDIKSGKRKRAYDASDEVPAGTSSGPQQASGTVKHATVNGKDQVTYGVASGDNLWLIGQKFGVSVDELKGWNDLRGRRPKLSIGQQLVIYPRALPPVADAVKPAPGSAPTAPVALASLSRAAPATATAVAAPTPAPAAAPAAPSGVPDQVTVEGNRKHIVHVLAPGDSLWSLSQHYGVTVDDLKRWNHVSHHRKLRAGERVTIEVADK